MNARTKNKRVLITRISAERISLFTMILAFTVMGCRLTSCGALSKNVSGPTGVSPAMLEESIFHDDFNDQLDSAWNWQNGDASVYTISDDGWLEIGAGDENMTDGGQQANLLWITLPEGSFEISIHLKVQPFFDFQRAGFILYNDAQKNYISLSRGYCMQCVLGGNGVFLEYNFGTAHSRFSDEMGANDLYLMIVVERQLVSAFYAVEPDEWQHLASLEYDNVFERVALTVANNSKWDNGYDVVGMFDYFDIQRPGRVLPTPTSAPFYQVKNSHIGK